MTRLNNNSNFIEKIINRHYFIFITIFLYINLLHHAINKIVRNNLKGFCNSIIKTKK